MTHLRGSSCPLRSEKVTLTDPSKAVVSGLAPAQRGLNAHPLGSPVGVCMQLKRLSNDADDPAAAGPPGVAAPAGRPALTLFGNHWPAGPSHTIRRLPEGRGVVFTHPLCPLKYKPLSA